MITAIYTILLVFLTLSYPFAITSGNISNSTIAVFAEMIIAGLTRCLPISIMLVIISLLLKKTGHSFSGIVRIMFFINLAICLSTLFSARSQLNNLFSEKVHIFLFLSTLMATFFAGIIAQNAFSKPEPEIIEIYISELGKRD